MDNSSKILKVLEKMDEKLDKARELALENAKKIEALFLSLKGNGGKGLYQRIDEIERWIKHHPKECEAAHQLSRREIIARRALEAVIIGIIVGAIFAILQFVL